MNSLLLLVIALVALGCGYRFYGTWLSQKWGVDNSKETPAHTMEDGIDYVPAKAPVLMGHHFSSIAGAGPITGPISAAAFGWLPCSLWIIFGGIFFGGVHDYGALFASVRHGGKSIGEIISANMSKRAKSLFIIFAYLTLILVVAVMFFGWRYMNKLVGEDNARNVGVHVKKVKLTLLITVSILIGVCVSIGGTISFVGLVTPHMARMLVGPNHKKLLPASMIFGAAFLLLADLAARTILRPIELSIGVVTSLVGAAAFVVIFRSTRKGR